MVKTWKTHVYRLLLEPEESDVQPLHIAAQEGHMEVAQFLVEARAFVEASDTDEVEQGIASHG